MEVLIAYCESGNGAGMCIINTRTSSIKKHI